MRTFKTDRLVAAVPQRDLRQPLGLLSMCGLAQMMVMNYSTLRWHISNGRIPYPQNRLVRRAYYTREEAETIAEAWKTRT